MENIQIKYYLDTIEACHEVLMHWGLRDAPLTITENRQVKITEAHYGALSQSVAKKAMEALDAVDNVDSAEDHPSEFIADLTSSGLMDINKTKQAIQAALHTAKDKV